MFLEEFREHMRAIKPFPIEHRHKRNVFVHKNLFDCSHVFLKAGPIRRSLEPPYSGRESMNYVQQAANSTTHVPTTISQPVALDSSSDNSVQPVNWANGVPSCNDHYDTLNVGPPLKTYSKKRVNFNIQGVPRDILFLIRADREKKTKMKIFYNIFLGKQSFFFLSEQFFLPIRSGISFLFSFLFLSAFCDIKEFASRTNWTFLFHFFDCRSQIFRWSLSIVCPPFKYYLLNQKIYTYYILLLLFGRQSNTLNVT